MSQYDDEASDMMELDGISYRCKTPTDQPTTIPEPNAPVVLNKFGTSAPQVFRPVAFPIVSLWNVDTAQVMVDQ